ncbi:MAG TPA: enoyl-CoA hydratase-related protein [Saprospiraceae bacterium]|nr:enoyl-CoA hydratase-related protein [Saprospiraceae bacterium]
MSDFTYESLVVMREGDVTSIKFNRPDRFNSFNQDMAFEFQRALDKCAVDGTRCAVITGEGKAFSAGQDLNEVVDPNGPPMNRIVSDHFNPIIRRLRELNLPVVAAVNGVAAGAGANIALACDVVIAKESSYFLQAFSAIGLIPDSGGTYHLPRLIGWQRASALMMLGDKVGAKEAEAMGMIYKVIPDTEWDHYLAALVQRLANMPTKGLALTKRALNLSLTSTLYDQLKYEEQLQTKAGKTDDYAEGVKAFLEKRKANFTGR